MKRFSFRLDRLLHYRKYLEKQAQKNLYSARREALSREKALKRLVERRMATERKCRDEGFRGMDVPLYRIYQSFLQKSNDDLETARIQLQEEEQKGGILRPNL